MVEVEEDKANGTRKVMLDLGATAIISAMFDDSMLPGPELPYRRNPTFISGAHHRFQIVSQCD